MANKENTAFYMPAEWEKHEGTWLQWPHDRRKQDEGYKVKLEDIWVTMTKELHYGEIVHIIVYDEMERKHVQEKLSDAKVNLANIDFLIQKTDDIWIRDNGPTFVKDRTANLSLINWNFNGWGNKCPYADDSMVPQNKREIWHS